MGNVLTTMLSEALAGAWCFTFSNVAFKTLSGTSPTKSLIKWLASSKLPLKFPGLPSFSISPLLRILNIRNKHNPDTVMTPEAEKRYWKRSAKDRVALQRSDARFVGEKSGRGGTRVPADLPPLVLYYTPALPPLKEKDGTRKRRDVFNISAKNYCKWHRMVFPGGKHPTIAEATRLRNDHDPDELREMHRISRMLSDDEVFQRSGVQQRRMSSKYRKEWKKWLALRPGGDIFFEEPSLEESITDSINQEERLSRRIRKLTTLGSPGPRSKDLDRGYDVKTMLPILIKALH